MLALLYVTVLKSAIIFFSTFVPLMISDINLCVLIDRIFIDDDRGQMYFL